MANHKTGSQRYNDRMDKIFKRSEELGNHTLHGSTEKKHEVAKKMKSEVESPGFAGMHPMAIQHIKQQRLNKKIGRMNK